MQVAGIIFWNVQESTKGWVILVKVRIGALEICDPTWDELDRLIERYGGGFQLEAMTSVGDEVRPSRPISGNGSSRPCDRVVLERLARAGVAGVPTQDVGEVLGRRGKSIRPGLIEWARRMGLVHDENIDPFEECRAGSRRGVRFKSSFQHVAEQLLGEKTNQNGRQS